MNPTQRERERGDVIDAFNRRIIKSGISPTLTTRPEGFKTAILVVVDDKKAYALTPKRTEYGKAIRKKYESHEIYEQ